MTTILLTNDDGIDAPGLAALARAAERLDGRVVTVAPAECHSGCGHRVTTKGVLAVTAVGHDRWRVAGTPADCVRMALGHLVPETTLVLSGINRGGNLGVDVHHSGTVAAAREAALHGRAAVAVSQLVAPDGHVDWERATGWLVAAWSRLVAAPAGGGFWNVNLPALPAGGAVPPLVECPVDASPFALAYQEADGGWRWASDYHRRPRRAGADVAVCFGGAISVSPVAVV